MFSAELSNENILAKIHSIWYSDLQLCALDSAMTSGQMFTVVRGVGCGIQLSFMTLFINENEKPNSKLQDYL